MELVGCNIMLKLRVHMHCNKIEFFGNADHKKNAWNLEHNAIESQETLNRIYSAKN